MKKGFKTVMLIAAAVVLAAGFLIFFIGKTNPDIDVIYVVSGYAGLAPEAEIHEYKVDLKNRQLSINFTAYENRFIEEHIPRDETAPNEGFTFLKDLQMDKINAFSKEMARAGFPDWEEYYPFYVTDTMGVSITIVFSDGTRKEIYIGAGNYPDTYTIMFDAFADLTGLTPLPQKMER